MFSFFNVFLIKQIRHLLKFTKFEKRKDGNIKNQYN